MFSRKDNVRANIRIIYENDKKIKGKKTPGKTKITT